MSCGNPHATECSDVLDAAFLFIDDEMDDGTMRHAIEEHLEECGPCLKEMSIIRRIKELVFRSSGDFAPDTLRKAIRGQITQLRLTMTEVDIRRD